MATDVEKMNVSDGLDQSLAVQTTDTEDVDRAIAKTSTRWVNNDWTTYNGYYKKHSSVKAVMNKLSIWTLGKGIISDKKTTRILDRIKGWGKETAEEVIMNMIKIKHVNGDSYSEIITTDGKEIRKDGSNLLNLKPLNPGSIGHLVNSQGILVGYKQRLLDGSEKTFKVNQILHFCLNRDADEIHGTSDIESLTTFLDKIKQLDEDMSLTFHRFVVPMIIWKLNTDDTAAIAKFQTYEKSAINKGNNLIVPQDAVGWDLLEAGKGVGKIINPMEWRNKWTEEIIKGGGVPALIMAIESSTTEASSKMVFLAWELIVDEEQASVERQIKSQLGLKIKFSDPPKIDQSLVSDNKKDANYQTKIKPNETKATLTGAK